MTLCSPTVRRTLLPLAAALVLAASAAPIAHAAPPPINEPPVLPVVIVPFPTNESIEADGFTDGDLVDVLLIRNGVTISSILGASPVGGVLNVNGVAGAPCWGPVTPDMRPGDIVRYVSHFPNGTIRSIDQVHVMPITASLPVVIQNDDPATPGGEGIVEIHGTASDLNGQPIPLANVDQRVVAPTLFALNGRKTLRSGTDGTFSYDTANNPTGINWTVRYSGLVAGDVDLCVNGEIRVRWLGTIPANANELTIYSNSADIVPGPAPGTCTAPLEALDTTAPTAPSNLASTSAGPNSISFTWTASTDNVEVAGYEFRRDGVVIARLGPLVTAFMDTAIPAGAHNYTVVAYDNASPLGAGATPSARIQAGLGQLWGNRSAASNQIHIVQADVTPPSPPASLAVATGNGKAMPSWSPAADNVGVVSYGVFRNNVFIATVPSPTTTYKDSGLVTGTYNYSVDAVDGAGLHSPRTSNVSATVIFVPDTTPPTSPSGVAAVVSPSVHGRDAIVTWNAATDSMGVTGYRLFRNGAVLAVLGPTTLSYSDSALATATYTYRVDAFDAAANHSTLSAAVSAVIANDPPLAPHALIAHPSRDWIAATGYPAAQGPYVFTLLRGAQVFSSAPIAADGTGLVQVNHAGGGCWLGTTPDVRPGDVVRITNAAGIAEQSTVSNVTAQFAVALDASTVVVHGTAQDAAGHPLPIGQLEHRLAAAAGTFAKNGSATLRAGAGLDGTLAYDAAGSTHWTATYSGLAAGDVALATGGAGSAAESRGLWLGRTPASGNEQSTFETGPGVMGGSAASVCSTPAETAVPAAAMTPAGLLFGDVGAIPPAVSSARTVEFRNNGLAPMAIRGVYIAGRNTGDFSFSSFGIPAVLAPGAAFTVDVTFAPKALGARRALLCLSCDAANTTALDVTLDGNGATDTTPPTVPGAVAAGVRPDVHGRDAMVTWSPASDSVGVTGYTIYRDGASIGTVNAATLAFQDAGLSPAPHAYAVDAFDLQNNHSARSAAAVVVIANDPPASPHAILVHPARDGITAAGYPAARGPYVFTLYRGSQVFTSAPVAADANGVVELNGAGGGCWAGVTPDVRRGDVVRITDATGFADQTTVADITAGFALAADSTTIEVHGTARDASGRPLPLDQIEHVLVASAGVFDKSGTASLHAGTAGGEGTLAYDAADSTRWIATYAGLSAADVVRAAGGTDTPAGTFAPAESRGVWKGRSPATSAEGTVAETGPGVMGGPATAQCAAPAEASVPAVGFQPMAVAFDRQGILPGTPPGVLFVIVSNTGSAPMTIRDVRVVGLHASDFSIAAGTISPVLAPGASFTLRVEFTAKALGHRQAALAVSCDAASTTALTVPLTGDGWSGLVLGRPGTPSQTFARGGALISGGVPGQGTIPIVVRWAASASAWVSGYDLQMSVNGGPYADAPVQPGAATEATLPLALNVADAPASYRFRVRATGGDQTTAWAQGTPFVLEPVDETNAARVGYIGAWSRQTVPGSYGGTVRTCFDKLGVRLIPGAPFVLPGSIAWITTMGRDRGMVSVQTDSRDSVMVDLYADTLRAAVVGYVAENLQAGRPHTLLVRSLLMGNKLAIANRVDVDAFVIMWNMAHAGTMVQRTPSAMTTPDPEQPSALAFRPIAPNPAVNKATLTFALPRDGAVRLDVLDVQGRLVRRIADGVLPAGEHSFTWDGRTGAGGGAGSGVYFAVLRYGEQSVIRRMIWMP